MGPPYPLLEGWLPGPPPDALGNFNDIVPGLKFSLIMIFPYVPTSF